MAIVKLLYWLLLLPFLLGIFPMCGMPREKRTPGVQYLSGFFVMLAAFQLFAVPLVLREADISVLLLLNLVVTSLLAVGAVVILVRSLRKKSWSVSLIRGVDKGMSRSTLVFTFFYWCIFVCILVFQLYMAVTRASFDGDDAYYVAQSVMADQNGSMYEVDPYTGAAARFDARHATATVTMWIAVLARMTGIHATILSHTILPLVILPVVYLIYLQIGMVLCREKRMLPVFMILMALLQMFGYVSLYTKETFLMTRTWQGKAMAGNLVFPAILWILLYFAQTIPVKKKEEVLEDRETIPLRWGFWMLLLCINTFAAMCSSLAAFLAALMIAAFGLMLSIQKRNLKLLFQLALSCVPCVIYMGLYIILR